MKSLTCRTSVVSGPGMYLFLTLLVALLVLQAPPLLSEEPDEDHAGDGHEQERDQEHDEAIQLDAAELQEFGIVVSEAGPATIQLFLDLPGEIQANDNQLAHIVPRFSGIVTEVRAQIGD